jgi:AcrR family transcriptional regulator
LYAHFGSRDGVLAAVAIEGFKEIGVALEKARKRDKRGNAVESVAAAYLEFAVSSPALYEVMFSLNLSVTFGDPRGATPPELHFAFSQVLALFQAQSSKPEVASELFWASLHGIAELTRTKRFPRRRQKERVRALVELFTFPREETAQVVKERRPWECGNRPTFTSFFSAEWRGETGVRPSVPAFLCFLTSTGWRSADYHVNH